MATRTISTRLAIEGESEYRQSISKISGEIKTLQSSLKLAESEFKNNANSMEALKTKGEALNALYKAQESKVKELRSALENAENAEKKYAEQKANLISKIDENKRKLEELRKTADDTADQEAELTAENKDLEAQLEKCDAGLTASQKGVTSWKDQLNKAETQLNDLNADIKLNDEYLEEARNSTDHCATSIDRFGDRVKKSADNAAELRDALAAAGVIAALKMTADELEACVDASIEYESAMAGVAKTTDLTSTELSAMAKDIQELSLRIPATTTEIANVTEAAGQLGIAKEDLLSFAEVMVNLGVATNLTSTEAASALAKFANVVGMSADSYERLGSTIVHLGNNFATTEADIVSMATRLASSGSIIGLSESQIMAVATALSSVGIEAEAGGSAVSKLLKQFETMVATGSPQLEAFASVAGLSAEEFSQKWGQDAVGALSLFIDGLGAIDDAGGSSVAVLDELGIKEVRLSNAVQALASSHGILNKALTTAGEAWKENTALANEAATRYETTESKLQMLSNSANNVKIAVGDKLTPALGSLADTGKNVLDWAAEAISESDAAVPILTSVATVVGVLSGGIVVYTAATKLATAASALFTATLDANPIFLAVTAIAALSAGVAVLVATSNDAVQSVKDLTQASREMGDAFEDSEKAFHDSEASIKGSAELAKAYIERLKELSSQVNESKAAEAEYRMTVDALNQLYPELNLSIDENTKLINADTDALLKQVDAMADVAMAQALQSRYADELKKYSDAEAEVYINQAKLNKAEAEHTALAERRAQVDGEIQRINLELTDVLNDSALEFSEQERIIKSLSAEQDSLVKESGSLADQMADNEKVQKNLNKAIAEGNETLTEYKIPMDEASAALELYTEEQEKNREATELNTEAQARNEEAIAGIEEELSELASQYSDAYDAAYKSIDGQIKLFDDYAATIEEDTDTVEEMMDRWSKQTENLGKYTENLKKAAEYGLDEGLISSLADGSTESAGYLATIIEKIESLGGSTEGMSENAEEFVSDFNASFAKTEEAKESFATTVAEMETNLSDAISAMEQRAGEVNFDGFSQAVESAFASVDVTFSNIGINIGAGLTQGINSSKADVESSASGLGDSAADAARKSLGEHSPSTVFDEIGQNADLGLIGGIDKKKPDVVKSVTTMGDDLSKAMVESAKSAIKAYDDEFGKINAKTKEQIAKLKATINGTKSDVYDAGKNIGAEIDNGMIAGLNNRSSALYSKVTSIVNTAIKKAKEAAAVHSPSKKTVEIFENVGEGMAVGVENKRKRVSDAVQSVVEGSLNVDVKNIPHIDDRMPDIVQQKPWSAQPSGNVDGKRIEEAINKLERRVEQLSDGIFVLDGDTIVGKWMRKIDRGLGKRLTEKERGLV